MAPAQPNRARAAERGALLASDGTTASALIASPGFAQTSCGFLGASDGWTDLRDDRMVDWALHLRPER